MNNSISGSSSDKQDKTKSVDGNDQSVPLKFWQRYKTPIILTIVGGAIDTIGFIALLGFFTAHVTGNLVMAGGGFVKGGEGLWIKLAALPLFILTVMITKYLIDKTSEQKPILSHLLFAEAVFLTAFMIAGLYFRPFDDAGSITVAITGGLGLVALAIRNTAGKTVIKQMSPTVLMTGNTTQLGINLSDFVSKPTRENAKALSHSFALVASFVIGAFLGAVLYVKLSFWSIGLFVLPVLYLSVLARNKEFCQQIG